MNEFKGEKDKNMENKMKFKQKINLKELRKSAKGITLIALVITIIVLLILAGVTIATLTGDNGILTRAQEAKNKTEQAQKDEENVLNSYEDKINEYTAETNLDLSQYIKIGDYVNYTPETISEEYNKFEEKYSGYVNENIGKDDTLKWRVLNLNKDGSIDLISDKPVSIDIYFKGARGYNNGVYLLNDYCRTMYSNSSKEATARSINIEDIQEKMIVNESTGKKAYENYTNTVGIVYGIGKYQVTSNLYYPLRWKNDNGIIGESTQTDLIEYLTEDDAKGKEDSMVVITQTFWYLSADDMKSNFILADTRDSSKSNCMYYELLCNNGNSQYWLASRYASATNDLSSSIFGLRFVNNGSIDGRNMFWPDGSARSSSCYCLPIVTLKSNSINLKTDYEKVGCWELN